MEILAYHKISLHNEDRIVWLEDIEKFDYVRMKFAVLSRRKGRPSNWSYGDRLVGYAEWRTDAKPYMPRWIERRVFWLQNHDRDSGNKCYTIGAPTEAVDPRTVTPGVIGYVTKRAWGGKLS